MYAQQHSDIARMMADHLYQAQRAIEKVESLERQVKTLTKELDVIKSAGGDLGWMTIKKAAPLVGMTTSALAQRFRRGAYPEGVVWSIINGRYNVNLGALRDHMARGGQ